jgi:HAMP domain-containing protein
LRRRLLQSLVPMVAVLAVVAAVPLANFIATGASRTLFLSRSNDADWFATMAESPLQTGDIANLRELAVRYQELYDTPVFVVDVDSRVVATSRSGVDVTEPDIEVALASTLAGRLPAEPPALWPWRSGEMVVARPVVNNGRVLGAAVLRVPTENARDQVQRSLLLLLGGLLISIGAIVVGIVRPITRWVLRPLKDLDNATHQITRGALDTRVSTDGRAPELRRLGDSTRRGSASVSSSPTRHTSSGRRSPRRGSTSRACPACRRRHASPSATSTGWAGSCNGCPGWPARTAREPMPRATKSRWTWRRR